jgi:nicotinate-nucleotide adenylyltransferase
MQIGLYFGSFNPVHIGHLIIAQYALQHTAVQQIWWVVSPQNPHKPVQSLLNEYQRLHLVNLAVQDNHQFKVVDVEFTLPKPSYTVHTLAYLHEKYPQHQFSILMGADSYTNLPKWKNWEVIIKNHPLLVYARPGIELPPAYTGSQTHWLQAPLLDISATYIRQQVKAGKSIQYLVTPAVQHEIENNRYYQ